MRTLSKNEIYLDHNAGAPLHFRQVEALLSSIHENQLKAGSYSDTIGLPSQLGNPSSIHSIGRRAFARVDLARQKIAKSLGLCTQSDQVFFCSSGTEANQWVIRGVLEASGQWVTSQGEHDSVRALVPWAKKQGIEVIQVGVDREGLLDTASLLQAIAEDTCLVSLIWVNNETGVITDVQSLIRQIRALPAFRGKIHLDGAQAWGKIAFDLSTVDADFVTFSGHKIGGLPGIGVVWTKSPKDLTPLIFGSQEQGKRGGTENLLGILSLEGACEKQSVGSYLDRILPIQRFFEKTLKAEIPGCRIHGENAPRVPGVLNLGFEGVEESGLVVALDLEGYCVSSGSACRSGLSEPSHVLLAMGWSEAQARSALRVCFSESFDRDGVEQFVKTLKKIVTRFRDPCYGSTKESLI